MPELPPPAAAVAKRPPPSRLTVPPPRVALVIAMAALLLVVLYLGRGALAPFIVGALLIYLLDPAVGWVARIPIGKWRIPRGLAVLIVYLITAVVVVQGLGLLIGPLVSQLLAYVSDLPALLGSLDATLQKLRETYVGLELPEPVRNAIDQALADIGQGAGSIDFGLLLPVARSIVSTAASFFGFLIIPIWAFYILRDRVRLTESLMKSFPETWRDEIWAVLVIIERVFGRWIRGQILLGLTVGAATFVGLLVLGWLVDPRFIEFAVFLAVIAGVLELLPIIGPIISAIPTLLIALITDDPLTSVVGVVILYTAVQQIENAVLVPKIQGDAVDLHPSIVILALIIGGSIAGLLGAILAIPITAAARDVYRYLFIRLSENPPEDAADDVAQATAEPTAREPAADAPAGDSATATTPAADPRALRRPADDDSDAPVIAPDAKR